MSLEICPMTTIVNQNQLRSFQMILLGWHVLQTLSPSIKMIVRKH